MSCFTSWSTRRRSRSRWLKAIRSVSMGPSATHESGHFYFAQTGHSHFAATLNETEERLLQGPFSDAMPHAGQLAMLRRLAGSQIPPEDFIIAAIQADNVGPDQPRAVSPDKEWPERP